MENGFINEFGIKIVLKSFEERVLIFTTSIENFYIFKVTKHKEDCRNNQSLKSTYEDVNKNPKKSIPNPSKWIFQEFPKKIIHQSQ